jgi:4-amino-4-deoxy-L-arabinose transferase-like glycosyltransferase
LLAKATDSLSERPSTEPLAEGSPARWRRRLTLVLPLILLVLVQTALAFREPIFSPIDELQHAGYVRTIAMQAQLPVYGENENDPTLVALYYQKSAWGVPRLAPARLNYEALQFPLFYLLAAPVYKLLAQDQRAAIYGVRLLNVLLSAVVLVLLVVLLRRAFRLDLLRAMAIALPLALVPGVSLRSSQVTNQVLATVLLTALLAGLVIRKPSRPGLQALLEGAALGLAVLAKLTAIAIVPAVLLGWFTRRARRESLVGGTLGALLTTAPWMVWSVGVYGSPVPFLSRHPKVFAGLTQFIPPHTLAEWRELLQHLVYFFWLPWEWRVPDGWSWFPRVLVVAASVLFVAVTIASIRLVLRAGPADARRALAISALTFGGFLVSYGLFVAALQRIWPTDLRELYIFLGAVAILLGPGAARFPRSVLLGLSASVVVSWLVLDAGYYAVGHCVC